MAGSSQNWPFILKDLRAQAGLSERAAAEKAGIARSTLRKMEAGGFIIMVEKLECLLDIYGYDLEAVLRTKFED